jgi:hypothetical protein
MQVQLSRTLQRTDGRGSGLRDAVPVYVPASRRMTQESALIVYRECLPGADIARPQGVHEPLPRPPGTRRLDRVRSKQPHSAPHRQLLESGSVQINMTLTRMRQRHQRMTRHDLNRSAVLTVPALIDYSDGFYVCFTGKGRSDRYEDADLDNYYAYLQGKNFDLASISLDDLGKHHLILANDDDQPRANHPIVNSSEKIAHRGNFRRSQSATARRDRHPFFCSTSRLRPAYLASS